MRRAVCVAGVGELVGRIGSLLDVCDDKRLSRRDETVSDLKAYKVSCCDDDHGAKIVFAVRGRDVSKFANSDQCDCALLERTVRRSPEFDKYAGKRLTPLDHLAEGWWYECCGCGHRLHHDDSPLMSDNEDLFCGPKCVEQLIARWTPLMPSAHESVAVMLDSARRLLDAIVTAPNHP